MKILKYIIIVLLLLIILLISSYFILNNNNEDLKQEQTFCELVKIAEENTNNNSTNAKIADNINFQELYEINNDIVAWIRVKDTNINYPVMQNKEDKEYYLRRDFYKKYSYWGTPFLAENCDINSSNNLIIYGHHINGTRLFGELEKYKNEKFYQNHRYIDLYTKNQHLNYEIFAIIKTNVNSDFKYFQYSNFNNEREFETFVKQCRKLSIFNSQIDIGYGNNFITLSTCDYSTKNGRLVIIAKLID